MSDLKHKLTQNKNCTCTQKSTHIDNPLRRILQINPNREVDEVIHTVSHLPEPVDRLPPVEVALAPPLPLQHGPPAELLQDLLDGLQPVLLDQRLVHAGLVQLLGQHERLGLVGLDGLLDHRPQLLLEHVSDDAEGGDRGLVVGDVGLLEEVAAGELVEVVARLDRGVHLLQDVGCGVDAAGGQAEFVLFLVGVVVVGVDDGWGVSAC